MTSLRRVLAALTLLLALAPPARADEFRPAYLQLVQVDSVTYDVLWKVPALDESRILAVSPVFPAGTEVLGPVKGLYSGGMAVQRWRIRVPGGLLGQAVTFPALATNRIDVLARMVRLDGTVQLERILAASPRFVAKASPGPLEVVRTYTVIGIEHILLGFDHLLFVLALVLIVRGFRTLLLTITAFTVAHSISLALATLDIVRVPGPPVEAIIALSIVFVASEIVHQQRGIESLAARKPWLVAFAFGLLHGLGFAGALAEVGLPQNAIPLALLFFNVGVELGQVAFVLAVIALARLGQRVLTTSTAQRRLVTATAYAIGAVASYWTLERVAGFWG